MSDLNQAIEERRWDFAKAILEEREGQVPPCCFDSYGTPDGEKVISCSRQKNKPSEFGRICLDCQRQGRGILEGRGIKLKPRDK